MASNTFRELSKSEWTHIASATGLSEDEVRTKISEIQEFRPFRSQVPQLSVADSKTASCKDFDLDIKIFRVKGTVCFTAGTDWKASLDARLYLAGIEVAHVKYQFSAKDTGVCYDYDILIGSLHVCFGVRQSGSKYCLYTSGRACGFGECASWNENIVCF